MDDQSSFIKSGSHAVSVYTRREEIVFGIFESELDSLSDHNTLSTVCFSMGSLFAGKFIDTLGSPISQNYHWLLLFIVPYILGAIIFWKKMGLTNRIKKKSKPI